MYVKSENLQALQSQQMLTEALLTLMKVHPFDEITVTQICQEAKVVRKTFYRNFETKTDILEFYFDHMIEKYLSNYSEPGIDWYLRVKSFFDDLLLYKEFLKLLEQNNLLSLLNKTIDMNISKYSLIPKIQGSIENPKLDEYVSNFITSTVSSILSLWVKHNFEESTEMLTYLVKIFLSGLKTVKI
jgi:Transcriptional regulator